ncbi:Long-chain fatty alcohol dehydrogenase family protein [Prunus dulcis]|uniref:Long-chain fatty alcohol dehydrogenase family protein n=1 Tax=Prunus dulcis TaxID=3755 RepID=A0A4Y1RPP0_PRUDU|nr:Long-chain fatty alcohol dehydrogenase family protein [Prunus dulcis]
MGAWSMMEDVSLCEAWVQVSHCPVMGNEIKFSRMWKKIHQAFCERAIGSTRTEMALSSMWKVLNKEFVKWRNVLAKAMDNHRSRENLSSEIMQAQMWFGATGQGKKSFNHTHCWEVVKTCKRFQIIPTGPTVVLNETSLYETPASDSPMDFPMSQDSPIEKEPRPIGRKAAKVRRWSNSSKNASKFLEELSKNQAMRIEMDLKQQEHDMAIQLEYAKEMEYVREQNIEKKDRETMAMDTSHMSPETKQF